MRRVLWSIACKNFSHSCLSFFGLLLVGQTCCGLYRPRQMCRIANTNKSKLFLSSEKSLIGHENQRVFICQAFIRLIRNLVFFFDSQPVYNTYAFRPDLATEIDLA